MGLEFFKSIVALQKKFGNWGAVVANGLQTNATLITDEMAAFFSKYKFLLGVSIDGPAEIHDRYRKGPQARGSHADVLKGIDRLKRHRVEFNALVLVSSANVADASSVYEYLLSLGIYYHQYIPCVEFDSKGNPEPYSISGKQWGTFLCDIFDQWIKNDTHRVSIRHFDAILSHMIKWRYNVCHMAGNCCQYFLVEYNGDVYPCDFFVQPQKKLGNINQHSWEELGKAQPYRSFGKQKANWNSRCAACEYLRYCSGDCLKNRIFHGKDSRNVSWLCDGWRAFYRHSLPAFEKLALSFLNSQQTVLSPDRRKHFKRLPEAHIKRNEACYCGSGKKYKHCHGAGKKRRAKPERAEKR